MASDLYALGVGYNVPLINLTRVTAISIPGGSPLADPLALPLWDDGDPKVRLGGLTDPIGYSSIIWKFGILFPDQYGVLRSTYCNNSLSGYVTIYTTVKGSVTYKRYNAIMSIKSPATYSWDYWYKVADVTFTRLEELA